MSRSDRTKKKLRRKIVVALATTLTLLVVLLPFTWSRVCSPANRLKIHTGEPNESREIKNSFSIACYNIAHGRGLAESNWSGGDEAARMRRLDEIASLLKTLDADVVVLNEVDFDASWSHQINQAEYLAEKAGYSFRVEERNLDFQVLHYTWRIWQRDSFAISDCECRVD